MQNTSQGQRTCRITREAKIFNRVKHGYKCMKWNDISSECRGVYFRLWSEEMRGKERETPKPQSINERTGHRGRSWQRLFVIVKRMPNIVEESNLRRTNEYSLRLHSERNLLFLWSSRKAEGGATWNWMEFFHDFVLWLCQLQLRKWSNRQVDMDLSVFPPYSRFQPGPVGRERKKCSEMDWNVARSAAHKMSFYFMQEFPLAANVFNEYLLS